jgi:hypothetical protein
MMVLGGAFLVLGRKKSLTAWFDWTQEKLTNALCKRYQRNIQNTKPEIVSNNNSGIAFWFAPTLKTKSKMKGYLLCYIPSLLFSSYCGSLG